MQQVTQYGQVLWKDDKDWMNKCIKVADVNPRGKRKRTWKDTLKQI